MILILFNIDIHQWSFIQQFTDLMKILTVIHNYYEQILTKFIFERFSICTKSSVLLDEKGNGISKCKEDKQKARRITRRKKRKIVFPYFSLPT